MDDEDSDYATRVVALFDFDPSTIDWPFASQRPLPLNTGQVVEVIHDEESSDWALGSLVGRPDIKGYFPKNYTVPVSEYSRIMEDYDTGQPETAAPAQRAGAEVEAYGAISQARPGTTSGSRAPGPMAYATEESSFDPPARQPVAVDRAASKHSGDSRASGRHAGEPPAIPASRPSGSGSIPGLEDYAATDAQFGGTSSFDLSRSRMMRDTAAQAPKAAGRPAPLEEESEEEAMGAREDVERELRARAAAADSQQGFDMPPTPATANETRPEKDFVRRHVPMELQGHFLRKVRHLAQVVRRSVRVNPDNNQAYPADFRARATTVRISSGIEPPHARMAIVRSNGSGAKWTQMFRPGFNDMVNESFKVGCNASMLSKLYLTDRIAREQFQRMQIRDVNGVMWFELQRKFEHIFYQRMDYVDVMMYHPDAWGFPDASKLVGANPGEPINPFHGWCALNSLNPGKEMDEVKFLYVLRLRAFPEATFQALALGKIPHWVEVAQQVESAEKENEEDEDDVLDRLFQKNDDAGDGAESPRQDLKALVVNKDMLISAGLEGEEDVYVKVEDLHFSRDKMLIPDVLDAKLIQHRLSGRSMMRVFLRSRGNPDNMKQLPISPKMVKDMAGQLGIQSQHSLYWYCMFALRYPLAPEWDVIVKNDTRFYIHLETDTMQPIHPMIKQFRVHMDDCSQNEFLWEYRGFNQMKCSDCGLPDSIVWCMQCTDYFCGDCFLRTHKSPRGKKHWPMPIPGCRYLTAAEAARLAEHVPLLNVGFSNRRRFLARDNQSDKNGSRNGDTWLYFHADTFEAALTQSPEKRWFLKRLKPPRLPPGAEGYFYNFASDVLADDGSHILTRAHEQKAISLLQRNIRGAIIRKRIKKIKAAVLVIQKNKQMWDVKKQMGKAGKHMKLLTNWYTRYHARQERTKLEHRITRVQAYFRGHLDYNKVQRKRRAIIRLQTKWKLILAKRRNKVIVHAGTTIQRVYRGHLYGRRPMREMLQKSSKIQALVRGVAHREGFRKENKAAAYIQSHFRGFSRRNVLAKMKRSALKMQRNWRRFQAQLDVKIILYERLEGLRLRRQKLIKAKLEGAAAIMLQRNWRRHYDHERVVAVRREKTEADKRTSTLLAAFYIAAASLRHFVHPWWRHLPEEIQEVLSQVKASMQRTIGLVPVTGKLANEELGVRGLRVAEAKHLVYEQKEDPDLASHMLLAVSRQLLSHVPTELFAPTVNWACYSMAHQAVAFDNQKGYIPRETIPLGKELPPHPGDKLAKLWESIGSIRHHHDWLLSVPDESLPCLFLHGLPVNHRHVFLTAEVLVTMRQALDQPTISTDDHLRFQGLDATGGAQLMEVLGNEIEHRLPQDWPQTHGTVAALAQQMSSTISELQLRTKAAEVRRRSFQGDSKLAAKAKAKAKAVPEKPKAKAKAGSTPMKSPMPGTVASEKGQILGGKGDEKLTEVLPALPEGGQLSFFNRHAVMRVVQQLGYFMRDQNELMESVLAAGAGQAELKQNRFVSVATKLFETADRATHDHCPFVLSVVVFHMVLRGLMLRVMYHRAAMTLQKRYRYVKTKGRKRTSVRPAMLIQRCWRGLRAALWVMRRDDAAFKIQRNYKARHWNKRAAKLFAMTLTIQRLWLGAVHRKWLRQCHTHATVIQRHVRGMLIRVTLDKPGRQLAKRFQDEMKDLRVQRRELSESEYIARVAVIAAKSKVAMHRHRERNIDLQRMACLGMTTKQARTIDRQRRLRLTGAIQPARSTMFEPMIFALKRLQPPTVPKGAAKGSRVMMQVLESRKELERSLPRVQNARPHAAAKRGRAAVFARRLAKKPAVSDTGAGNEETLMVEMQLRRWMTYQLAVKQ